MSNFNSFYQDLYNNFVENPQNFADVRISPNPLPHVHKRPLLTTPSPFCGRPLWTAPYLNLIMLGESN